MNASHWLTSWNIADVISECPLAAEQWPASSLAAKIFAGTWADFICGKLSESQIAFRPQQRETAIACTTGCCSAGPHFWNTLKCTLSSLSLSMRQLDVSNYDSVCARPNLKNLRQMKANLLQWSYVWPNKCISQIWAKMVITWVASLTFILFHYFLGS